jgi:Alpha/beta hydrolase domain
MLARTGFVLTFAALCHGAVQKVEIIEKSDVPGSAYERVIGKVRFAVDPELAPNRIIADLDLAPKNAQGLVEFSADLYVLQPKDPAKSNGTALLEISNRGGKSLLSLFDFARGSSDPRTPEEFGDNFLLDQGFTLVWIGWEFDVPGQAKLMHLQAPVAAQNGKPITGLVRSEWEGDTRVTTIPLGDRVQIGYSVADPEDPANQLFVRDSYLSERRKIKRSDWKFADSTHVTMESGFDPGRIYEVVYRAKDPVVTGLGPAAVRDMVSYLKYEDKRVQRVLGIGVSQSGRFLRAFLYDGFNQDEQKRKVFDGVWAHVAGAGRGSFNFRFAQPSRDGHPFLNVEYPTDLPPFTDEGMLAKARAAHVEPKIFYSNGSYEYWGRAASLIHTTPDGKQDIPPSANERIYAFAGAQHTAGSVPPRPVEAQNLADTVDYRASMRALLVAMQGWLKDDKEPPPSRYPQIGKDQLVSMNAYAFPHLSGVRVPGIKREAYDLDFSSEPPKIGQRFVTLIPQVNLDGNESSGIVMPEVAVPLATYTGWNLRNKNIGGEDELYSMVGSFIPFNATEEQRKVSKDPRLSIESRYKSKQEFLEKFSNAAQSLAQQGYLLNSDIAALRERAGREWDYVQR